MAESALIDAYMHAQGHAFAAEDAARAAIEDFSTGHHVEANQHLAEAIATLSAALAGAIGAKVTSLGFDPELVD